MRKLIIMVLLLMGLIGYSQVLRPPITGGSIVGNTAITGTLDVSGATVLSSTLGITGLATLTADIYVNGGLVKVDGNKQATDLAQFINDDDGSVGDSSLSILKDGSIKMQTNFKFIIFDDTLCAVKVSTTDTARVIPTR